MAIPRWVIFVVAAWVILFGLYRIRLSFRKPPDPDQPNFNTRGLFAYQPRRHFLLGVIYLVLGGYLILAGFGHNPVMQGCGQQQSRAAFR